MSISPQSLARTRDKRHPRTPARFDDFIPPEATYRNVAEALRSKGSKNARSPFHPSITISNGVTFKGPNASKPLIEKKLSTPENNDTQTNVAKSSSSKPMRNSVSFKDLDASAPLIEKKPSTPENNDTLAAEVSKTSLSETIDDSVSLKGPIVSEPLIEKKPSSPENNNKITNVSKSSSSKKKTKGLSLMIRTSPNGPYYDVNNPQVVQRPASKQMRYSNLSQNMQYGSRLMLNEPIHLPKSVSTIAPITTTFQQIANQARKPPFISKKAEAYIAYQEARKFDYLLSSHKALVRIAQNLDYQDLSNLKKVNRTWRSVVMCDSVWRKVSVRSSTLRESNDFRNLTRDLIRHRTKELVLESICPEDDDCLECISTFCNKDLSLKRLIIKSENQLENRFALELLCGLNNTHFNKMNIIWRVKVVVSDDGLALVPIQCRMKDSCNNNKMVEMPYCHPKMKRLIGDPNRTTVLEKSELEDLFNDGNKDQSDTHSHGLCSTKPIVHIRPI